MIYGYTRVSTRKQIKGNSLDDQKQALLEKGCQEIIPEQYSAKTMDRPRFKELLDRLKPGDTLMVCKIDRLARSLAEGLRVIDDLISRGITVNILDLGVLDSSRNGKLIYSILMSIAEWEREMILERMNAGRAIARLKPGYREGRKPRPKEQIEHAVSLLRNNTYKQVADMTGISVASLVRYRRKLAKGN